MTTITRDSIASDWQTVFLENTRREEALSNDKFKEYLFNVLGFLFFPILVVFPILLVPLKGSVDADGNPQLDCLSYIIFQLLYNVMAFFTILIPFACAIPSAEYVILFPLIIGLVGIVVIYYSIFFHAPMNGDKKRAVENICLYGILFLNVVVWGTYFTVSLINSLKNNNTVPSANIELALTVDQRNMNPILQNSIKNEPSSILTIDSTKTNPVLYEKHNWPASFFRFNFSSPKLITKHDMQHFFKIFGLSIFFFFQNLAFKNFEYDFLLTFRS